MNPACRAQVLLVKAPLSAKSETKSNPDGQVIGTLTDPACEEQVQLLGTINHSECTNWQASGVDLWTRNPSEMADPAEPVKQKDTF